MRVYKHCADRQIDQFVMLWLLGEIRNPDRSFSEDQQIRKWIA